MTYSILIKIYSRKRDLDGALGLLDEMKVASVKPGLIVYTCLIQTCISADRITKAEELFQQMKCERVKPDAVMFATLIKGQLRQ